MGYAESYQNFGPAAQVSIASADNKRGTPFVVLKNYPQFDEKREGKYAISLLDVYECIEGELAPCDCLLTSPVCSGEGCIFGGLPASAGRQFREYLSKTRINQLTHLFCLKDKT